MALSENGVPIGDIIFPHENYHEAINLPHETDTPKSMIPWIHMLQYHIFISYSWLKSPVLVPFFLVKSSEIP